MLGFLFTTPPFIFLIGPMFISMWLKHFLLSSLFIYSKVLITFNFIDSAIHQEVWMVIMDTTIIFIWYWFYLIFKWDVVFSKEVIDLELPTRIK